MCAVCKQTQIEQLALHHRRHHSTTIQRPPHLLALAMMACLAWLSVCGVRCEVEVTETRPKNASCAGLMATVFAAEWGGPRREAHVPRPNQLSIRSHPSRRALLTCGPLALPLASLVSFSHECPQPQPSPGPVPPSPARYGMPVPLCLCASVPTDARGRAWLWHPGHRTRISGLLVSLLRESPRPITKTPALATVGWLSRTPRSQTKILPSCRTSIPFTFSLSSCLPSDSSSS